MSAVDLEISKRRLRRELNETYIDPVKQDLQLFGLDKASLGVQEIFRSAPKQVTMPVNLVDWIMQFYEAGLTEKIDIHDLHKIIRTKATENYYSSQQITASMEYALVQLKKKYGIIKN